MHLILFAYLSPLCSLFIVWQFMLSSSTPSQSGIPKNNGPMCDTTKKLHQHLLPLLIMVNFHTPICGIHELFYVHNIIFCLLSYLDT